MKARKNPVGGKGREYFIKLPDFFAENILKPFSAEIILLSLGI